MAVVAKELADKKKVDALDPYGLRPTLRISAPRILRPNKGTIDKCLIITSRAETKVRR